MKTLIFAVISFLLIAFCPRVFGAELSWLTPTDIRFQNIPQRDRIIPLGFSKTGIFSYILQQNSCHSPPENNNKISWVAVNLITDKTLTHIALGNEAPHVSAEDVLRKYHQIIEDHNSQHQIVMTYSQTIATGKSIESKNDKLKIHTKLLKTIEGEDAINPGYKKYISLLSSRTKGTKKLAEIISVYEPLRYWGYFKSPFEERVAILFISGFRGCDAYPQMRINIVGANLIKGFNTKINN